MRTWTQKLPKFVSKRGLSLLFLLAYVAGYSASGAFHELYHAAVDGGQAHHSAPLAPPSMDALVAADASTGETCELLAHLRALSELKDKAPESPSLKDGLPPALALSALRPQHQDTARILASGGPRAPPYALL